MYNIPIDILIDVVLILNTGCDDVMFKYFSTWFYAIVSYK
jgi:hypothetical protein